MNSKLETIYNKIIVINHYFNIRRLIYMNNVYCFCYPNLISILHIIIQNF